MPATVSMNYADVMNAHVALGQAANEFGRIKKELDSCRGNLITGGLVGLTGTKAGEAIDALMVLFEHLEHQARELSGDTQDALEDFQNKIDPGMSQRFE